MNQKPILKNTLFIGLTALVAWFAIIAQFVISIPEYLQKGRTLAGSFVQLLSYFTIQSNLLVAFSLSAVLLFPVTKTGRFFSKISTATAIAVYITIVSLVYNLVLRPFWHPKGFYKPVDELLHLIVPILYILCWLFLFPKRGLQWKQLGSWLTFPFIYLVYIILRGAATGFYPYFFVDVKTFGYGQVAVNAFFLLLVFAFFSAIFIFLGRLFDQQNSTLSS